MKALVIIPAYNEEKNILNTCQSILKIKKNLDIEIDLIVINDASTDNTLKVCEDNNIPVISLIQNLGIGGAVQTGYIYAYKKNYDIAIQFDGDGQHDSAYVIDLLKPIIKNDADMVVGSRYIANISEFKSTKVRQLGIKILSKILEITTKKKICDVTSGFRAVNKDLIKMFSENYPNDYPEPEILVEIIKKGYKVLEVPVKMHERQFGKSSITPFKSIYYMSKVSYSMIIKSIVVRKEKNDN